MPSTVYQRILPTLKLFSRFSRLRSVFTLVPTRTLLMRNRLLLVTMKIALLA